VMDGNIMSADVVVDGVGGVKTGSDVRLSVSWGWCAVRYFSTWSSRM
jgi:hypothetical protein